MAISIIVAPLGEDAIAGAGMGAHHLRTSWLALLQCMSYSNAPVLYCSAASLSRCVVQTAEAPTRRGAVCAGVMWCNVTCYSVMVGIQFGFGALCAQADVGLGHCDVPKAATATRPLQPQTYSHLCF